MATRARPNLITRWRLGFLLTLVSAGALASWAAFGAALPGAVITNRAQVGYADPGGAQFTIDTNTVQSGVSEASGLLVSISGPAEGRPEGEVVYTLTYVNPRATPTRDVLITLTLPPALGFVSSSPGGNADGGTITWRPEDLSPGGSGAIVLTGRLSPALAEGDTVTSAATISDAVSATTTSDPFVTRIGSAPRLTLDAAVAPTGVTPGESATFTLSYANIGSVVAPNVTLLFDVPDGLQPGSTPGAVDVGGSLRWELGDLDPAASGSVDFVAQVLDTAPAPSTIVATARIRVENRPSATTQTRLIVRLPKSPVWELALSSDATRAEPGDVVAFTITATNIGEGTATDALILYTLPDEFDYVPNSSQPAAVYDPVARTLSWRLSEVGPLDQVSMRFNLRVRDDIASGAHVVESVATVDSESAVGLAISPLLELTVVTAATPAEMTLEAEPATIIGDGRDTAVLTARVFDQFGNPVADGTPLTFATTAGSFSNGRDVFVTHTVAGIASTTLTADLVSNRPVEALAEATATTPGVGEVVASVSIVFSPGAIAGVLTDNATGAPLVGVLVTVEHAESGTGIQIQQSSPAADVVGTDVTDATGAYLVPIPRRGNYVVIVAVTDAFGRTVRTREIVTVSALFGQVHNPRGAITGAALDGRTGDPLAGVGLRLLDANGRVALDADGHPVGATTGADGGYQMSALPAGVYTVEVDATPESYFAHGALDVDVSAQGQYAYNANLAVEPLGLVFDRDTGEPLAGARVLLLHGLTDDIVSLPSYLGRPQVNPTVASDTGRYGFLVLPGRYSVLPTHADYDPDVAASIDIAGDTLNVDIPMIPVPQLSLSVTAARDEASGEDRVEYTLEYANDGGNATEGVLTFASEGMTFVSATDDGVIGEAEAAQVVLWDLGVIPAHSSASVKVILSLNDDVEEGTVLTHLASLATKQDDTQRVQVELLAHSPVLSLAASATPEPVEAGAELTYTLEYGNVGRDAADGVALAAPLPELTTFLRATGDGVESGGLVSWELGTLTAESDGVVTVVVRTDKPLDDGTSLSMSAELSGDGLESRQAEVETTVRAKPILVVSKSADPSGRLSPGDVVTYTLSYANEGNSVADDVVLEDVLPESVEYLDGGSLDPSTRGVSWDIGEFPPTDAPRTASFRARVRNDLAQGFHPIANVATLTDRASGAVARSNVVRTPVIVPYIIITKAANKRVVDVGGFITYSVTVANASEVSSVEGLEVRDELSPGLRYVEGSSYVNGREAADPTGDRPVFWRVGSLLPGE
jgi:uncharacterized repeat protein (TIGR01451 family)